MYDKFVAKVNNIDTNDFVLKTTYNTDKTELEKKIPNVTDFVKEAKLTEIENKIPDISNLGTKTALTTIENKVPDVSNFATKTELTNLSDKVPDITTLIKKGDYNTKIVEIENKYVSNSGFNTKLGEANVITKRNFDAKIIEIKNSIKKLKTFDLSYFKGKNHFEADSTQNYLVFQPIHR